MKAQAATITAKHSPIRPIWAMPLSGSTSPEFSRTSPAGSFHSGSRESAGFPLPLRGRQWKPPDLFPSGGRHEVPATGWPRDTLFSPTPTTAERGDPGAAKRGISQPSAPGEPCFPSLPYLSVPSRPGGATRPRYRLGAARASGAVGPTALRRGWRLRSPACSGARRARRSAPCRRGDSIRRPRLLPRRGVCPNPIRPEPLGSWRRNEWVVPR